MEIIFLGIRSREKDINVSDFKKGFLGDSKRQPHPSYKNLTPRPILLSRRRESEKEKDTELFYINIISLISFESSTRLGCQTFRARVRLKSEIDRQIENERVKNFVIDYMLIIPDFVRV